MNKITLAMNAWRAYTAARRTEGSSLRGVIMGGASAVAVVAITLLRGDLTATDVGVIAAGISGLDAVLKYFIPDQFGTSDDRPHITLIGKSQTVRTDDDGGFRTGNANPDSSQLCESVPPVDYVRGTSEAADRPGFNG